MIFSYLILIWEIKKNIYVQLKLDKNLYILKLFNIYIKKIIY